MLLINEFLHYRFRHYVFRRMERVSCNTWLDSGTDDYWWDSAESKRIAFLLSCDNPLFCTCI